MPSSSRKQVHDVGGIELPLLVDDLRERRALDVLHDEERRRRAVPRSRGSS